MNISIKVLFVFAAAVLAIASCKKNDDAPALRLTTSVNFVNTSNNTINIYLNGTRLVNSSVYFPGGTLGYMDVTAGTQNYAVKLAGNPMPLFTKSILFDTAKVYTLYIAGSTAEDAFYTTDTLVSDTGDYAKLRFVNASQSAGKMMVAFTNEGSANEIKFDTVSYKRTTPFIRVKSGTFNLGIYREAFPTGPLRDTVTLDAHRVYTLYSYGTVGASGNQGLSDGLIVNR